MSTIDLNQENLESTIDNNEIVIIDFWAPWCGPCVGFAPVFEAAAAKHGNIVFAKVNTQDEPQVASGFGIQSIPTLMVFRDQVLLYNQAGALPGPAFDRLIEEVLKVDMDDVRKQIAEREGQADEGELN